MTTPQFVEPPPESSDHQCDVCNRRTDYITLDGGMWRCLDCEDEWLFDCQDERDDEVRDEDDLAGAWPDDDNAGF